MTDSHSGAGRDRTDFPDEHLDLQDGHWRRYFPEGTFHDDVSDLVEFVFFPPHIKSRNPTIETLDDIRREAQRVVSIVDTLATSLALDADLVRRLQFSFDVYLMHPSLRSLTHDKLFHPSTEPSTLLDQSNFPPDHSHPINPDVREAAAIFVHELFELRLPLFRELELCRYEAEVSSRLRDDEDQYASAEFGNVPHNRRPIPLELDTPEGPQDRDVKRIRDRFAVIADPDWQPTLQPSRSSRKAVTDLTGSDRGTSPGTPQLDAIAK